MSSTTEQGRSKTAVRTVTEKYGYLTSKFSPHSRLLNQLFCFCEQVEGQQINQKVVVY